MLRNQVIESVLVANPILKAVHMGRDASLVEKSVILLPADRALANRHQGPSSICGEER